MWTLLKQDSREALQTIPENSIHTCVTSPPYYNLRDYRAPGQIGLEETPEKYVSNLVDYLMGVHRVLRPDGTLWLNLGDTYAACNRSGRDESPGVGAKQAIGRIRTAVRWKAGDGSRFGWTLPGGQKPKDLIGIPWMVAFALRSAGWYLRAEIIWDKPNAMPESVKDRPTRSHEQIFLLAKSRHYYYDHEAIKERAVARTAGDYDGGPQRGKGGERVNDGRNFRIVKSGNKERKLGSDYGRPGEERGHSFPWEGFTRNKRSVWRISTRPTQYKHHATFPPELVRDCILAGCPPGGTVLDPFCGTGTVLEVAERLGRDSIGIDISAECCRMTEERMGKAWQASLTL
jgi:DNA modification methylase